MKPVSHEACPDCGEQWCHGYRVERSGKHCWIWHETRTDKRGRLPRNKESVDNRYLTLLYLCNADPRSMGDDFDGYRDTSDLTDEELAIYRREGYGSDIPD